MSKLAFGLVMLPPAALAVFLAEQALFDRDMCSGLTSLDATVCDSASDNGYNGRVTLDSASKRLMDFSRR